MEVIQKYFPDLSSEQTTQLSRLFDLYSYWNERINIISRKDLPNLYERHVLHSLSILKFIDFKAGADVLDIGTGGGFPGVPLAILCPKVSFTLVDSTGKKVKVVEEVIKELGLKNVLTAQVRAEEIKFWKFDFVLTRAVAKLPQLIKWSEGKFKKESKHDLKNGLLALKGGEISEELSAVNEKYRTFLLNSVFDEPFFEEKCLIHVPLS